MQIEVTDQNIALINAIIYLAFALPALPLILGWRVFLKHNPGVLATIALGILSLSYLWIVAVLVGLPVIAPHYTQARANVINANAAAVVLGTILGGVAPEVRWSSLTGGPVVFMLWSYVAVIGSVV